MMTSKERQQRADLMAAHAQEANKAMIAVCDELRAMYRDSHPVECLAIGGIMRAAHELKRRLAELSTAYQNEAEGGAK